jgi:class 3 adenylate cyclase/GAF domain-containing protein/CheY-like chemotaxis protein
VTEPTHILVVDDDPDIRRLLELVLADAGYRVSLLGSGEEALAFTQLVTPDLMLLDLSLPGISGLEVAAQVKADHERPFVPIIVVTARADLRSRVTGLDAGADDLLVKPVDYEELLARVRAMLRLQRSQRSLQTEKRKTELLLDLTRELGATLDLNALLSRFLTHLSDVVGAVRGSIVLSDGSQSVFYSTSKRQALLSIDQLLHSGVSGWVLRERRPLVIGDTREDVRWIGDHPHQRSVRSVAAAPILDDQQVLGVITLVHYTPNYFKDDHIELLQSVAAQSASALSKAQLFRLAQQQNDLLEQRAAQLAQLNQVGRSLSELMEPEQLLRLASHLVCFTFGYESALILLAEGTQLTPRAWAGKLLTAARPQPGRLGEGVCGRVALEATPLRRDDLWEGEEGEACLAAHQLVRSLLAVPIVAGRETLGVLAVQSAQPRAFGANDEALLGTLALQIGVALANARLYRRVEAERSTLNAVLRSAADPILLVGEDGELLLANPAAERHLPELHRWVSAAPARGEAQPPELALPGGATFATSLATVRTADGRALGTVATLQDISAIKELERQRLARVQAVMRRYLSPAVVEELLRRGEGAFGIPEEREVAVLFADLRGYTALAEGLDARVLVEQVLNRYFSAMTEALHRYDGTIDKFLGDGIIAAFGTPLARPDDVERALGAAVEMQQAFVQLRRCWQGELGFDIGMGVGLAYGDAVVGNIGSEQHSDYTLIGDVVNTAARLSSIAGPAQIIVSHSLVERLPAAWRGPWQLRALDPVALRGKQEPHPVFEVSY